MEGERILGDVKGKWRRWTDRVMGFANPAERGTSRRRDLWLKARDGRKEKEKESGGRTLAWGSATCCASSGDSERRKEKTERTKTHFSCIPVGVLKPAAPHIAAPI